MGGDWGATTLSKTNKRSNTTYKISNIDDINCLIYNNIVHYVKWYITKNEMKKEKEKRGIINVHTISMDLDLICLITLLWTHLIRLILIGWLNLNILF